MIHFTLSGPYIVWVEISQVSPPTVQRSIKLSSTGAM
jgi:hypothetical protein